MTEQVARDDWEAQEKNWMIFVYGKEIIRPIEPLSERQQVVYDCRSQRKMTAREAANLLGLRVDQVNDATVKIRQKGYMLP